MTLQEEISSIVQSAFAPVSWTLIDDSDRHRGHQGRPQGSGHFTLKIVSEKFSGKSPMESHRMVYAALGHLIPNQIHALSLNLSAP